MGEQQCGNLQQAIEHYKKVIVLTQNDIPDNTLLRYLSFTNMAESYRELGDAADAEGSVEAAKNLVQQYGNKSRN